MRSQKEVKEDVLSRAGAYRMIHGWRETSSDPSPLKAKQVMVDGRRYVVCWNMEQQLLDRRRREHLIESLKKTLDEKGPKDLVGNAGYRRFLKGDGSFVIDEKKIEEEARYDGKWVLRTNFTEEELSTEDVAQRYKDLWQVEQVFRSLKSVLATRPVFHHWDETIRGHVFTSFLALMLLKELLRRLTEKQHDDVEWDRLRADLVALTETELELDGKRFLLRGELVGDAGKALQAAGVAIPPWVIALKEAGCG